MITIRLTVYSHPSDESGFQTIFPRKRKDTIQTKKIPDDLKEKSNDDNLNNSQVYKSNEWNKSIRSKEFDDKSPLKTVKYKKRKPIKPKSKSLYLTSSMLETIHLIKLK